VRPERGDDAGVRDARDAGEVVGNLGDALVLGFAITVREALCVVDECDLGAVAGTRDAHERLERARRERRVVDEELVLGAFVAVELFEDELVVVVAEVAARELVRVDARDRCHEPVEELDPRLARSRRTPSSPASRAAASAGKSSCRRSYWPR